MILTPLWITRPEDGRRVKGGDLDQETMTFSWKVGEGQRLRKWSAYAKDARLIEKLREAGVYVLRVADTVEDVIYTISMSDFWANKWLLKTKAGEQWACDKRHWEEQ